MMGQFKLHKFQSLTRTSRSIEGGFYGKKEWGNFLISNFFRSKCDHLNLFFGLFSPMAKSMGHKCLSIHSFVNDYYKIHKTVKIKTNYGDALDA